MRKFYPSIECLSALLAPLTRGYSHRVGNPLDDVSQANFLFDEKTGQWIMALSGLEAYGTEAAGELVADPAFSKYLPATVRSTGNFQIVLKTSVLRGNTGPIEILAFHTW